MTLRKLCAALLVSSAAFCFAQAQPRAAAQKPNTKPEFTLHIAAVSHPLSLSGPINVFITATNVTNHTIGWVVNFHKDSKYYGFRYHLERNGNAVATTFFNRMTAGQFLPGDDPGRVPGALNGNYIPFPHAPGRMFKTKIDLKRLFKITQPGKYTFQVSRYDTVSKTTVRSNTIHLTIRQ